MTLSVQLRRIALLAAFVLSACAGMTPPPAQAPASGLTLFPTNGASSVNPDTHLVLTFASAPRIGSSGLIQIYDAADNSLVDTLDLSIPPSPRPDGRAGGATEAERQALGASTRMEDYQVNRIDGVDFHFFPIIVRGNSATITLHNGRLRYGHRYVVRMDASVLQTDGGAFQGFDAEHRWSFRTKSTPPRAGATQLTVATDGSGDFNTVQGALDFATPTAAAPVTIFIRNGRYEELVYAADKHNLILRGEDRERVLVTYPNNSAFNPPRGGPSRRPAFTLQDAADIQLSNFTITNSFYGQAEALLVRGERIVLDHMTLNGSGDAFTTYGSIYMVDSTLVGDGDTILGYASLFCLRCEIQSIGPFSWTRTPAGKHGNVFVDSTFVHRDRTLPWASTAPTATPPAPRPQATFARLPRNSSPTATAVNFPNAEMVLINTRTSGVPPEGWGPVEDRATFDWSNVRFMEFNTTDLEGHPIDLSQRHPIVRVLHQPDDDALIGDYSNPAFVLGGWTPVVR